MYLSKSMKSLYIWYHYIQYLLNCLFDVKKIYKTAVVITHLDMQLYFTIWHKEKAHFIHIMSAILK